MEILRKQKSPQVRLESAATQNNEISHKSTLDEGDEPSEVENNNSKPLWESGSSSKVMHLDHPCSFPQ